MEQFVLFPASVYNSKRFNTQTITTQEDPKCQVEQNPTYQTDMLKRK